MMEDMFWRILELILMFLSGNAISNRNIRTIWRIAMVTLIVIFVFLPALRAWEMFVNYINFIRWGIQ